MSFSLVDFAEHIVLDLEHHWGEAWSLLHFFIFITISTFDNNVLEEARE